MDLINFLTSYAYHFYPKNTCALKEKSKYENSIEFNRLIIKMNSSREKLGLDVIKRVITSVTNNEVYEFSLPTWHDRCLNFQFKVGEELEKLHVCCINISLVLPLFTIYILELDRDLEKNILICPPRRNLKLEENRYSELIDSLKTKLINEFLFLEFISEICSKVIPDINFQDIDMGKFTLFNAFFLNNFHTRLF